MECANRFLRSELNAFKVLAATAVLVGGFLQNHVANAAAESDLRDINAWFLMAPHGFDDNDEIQVVVDGYLPNDCHRVAAPEVVINQATRTISVQPRAKFYSFDCDQFMVPFSKVVELGILSKGDWTLKSPGLSDSVLQIVEATSAGPDDFLYAPLEGVTVMVRPDKQKITATLSGRFTNSCLMWETIRVIDSGDTIQLLPITRMQNRSDCKVRETSFDDVIVTIPWRGPGRYLLHSRSLNGQAVNTMFTVYGEGK